MAFAFVSSANGNVSGGTQVDWTANFALGLFMCAVYAFDNVAPGSGPWITPNNGQFSTAFIGPSTGWQQAAWIAPASAGVGIEVWCAINGAAGSQVRSVALGAAQTCEVVVGSWSGAYAPNGSINDGAVRAVATRQPTGNAPAAPSIFAFAGELVIAVCGDRMTAAKFGTPAGFTNRVDQAIGAAGTVEATEADAVAAASGLTGAIPFPNAAASSGQAGGSATLAIRPSGSVTPGSSILRAPMPPDLDLEHGYTLTVQALSPTTGAPVGGVNIGQVVVTATSVGAGSGGGNEPGQWFLVPGEGA